MIVAGAAQPESDCANVRATCKDLNGCFEVQERSYNGDDSMVINGFLESPGEHTQKNAI